MTTSSSIDRLMAEVRARISSLPAQRVAALRAAGALLIDTRPQFQREQFGTIPDAVLIERNHLEWRVDPTSAHRHPAVIEHDGPIVVLCQEGYSSVLAVGTLTELGVPDVHDLEGGFDAWVAAGLPIEPPARGGASS